MSNNNKSTEEIFKDHETTYLEVEIPEDLEAELSKYIKEKIRIYESSCKCNYCKQKKIEKNEQH